MTTTYTPEPTMTNLEAYHRLCDVIPGGVNSPARACRSVKTTPLIAARGHDDWIEDIEGNVYIDYVMSWGALVHGHAHPIILKALQQRMADGTTFGMTTLIEEKLARKVCDLVPSIEKVRFVSSGTEAAMSAVRLARGYTGKDYIVKFNGNYHGHADQFLVKAGSGVASLPTSSSAGIPLETVQKTLSLRYNDVEGWEQLCLDPAYKGKIAAVIVEPVAGNMGVVPASKAFLQSLRVKTQEIGAVLIFDEVMTGFRVARGGAQELYQISPDLTVLGKIVGGGLPAAAFGGSAQIMDHLAPLGNVYQAGTLSGNPLAMEAGYQTLELLDHEEFYPSLQKKADFLVERIRGAIKACGSHACVQQVGSMFTLFLGRANVTNMEEAQLVDHDLFADFYRTLLTQGISIPPSPHEAWFISAAHTQQSLEKTATEIEAFLKKPI